MAVKLITVAETPLFARQAEAVWDDDERTEFVTFIAANPEAGDVIAGTGGVRKVRWSRAGTGKGRVPWNGVARRWSRRSPALAGLVTRRQPAA